MPLVSDTDPYKEGCPRTKGSKPHITLPSLGIPHGKDEQPEHLALKTSVAYVQKNQRTTGNQTSTVKQ